MSSQGLEEEAVDDVVDDGCVNLCKTAEDGVRGILFLDLVNVEDKGVDGVVVESKFLLQLFTLSLFCKVLVGVLDGVLFEEEEMVTFLIPLLLTKGVSSSSSSSFFLFNGVGELIFQNNNN